MVLVGRELSSLLLHPLDEFADQQGDLLAAYRKALGWQQSVDRSAANTASNF
jgi:hypothetical protein